jgi:hypothetical protein
MGITENGWKASVQCITVQNWRAWVPSQIGIRRRMPRSAVCLPITTSTDAAYRARALYHHSTESQQRSVSTRARGVAVAVGCPLAQRQRHAEPQTPGICSMFQDRCRALFDVWLCGSLCVAGMPFDVCWLELTVRVWVAWGGGVLVLHGAALGDPGVDD